MGGATTIQAASLEKNIKAIAIESPFAHAKELVAQETSLSTGLPESITFWFVHGVDFLAEMIYGMDLDEMNPEDAVKKINYPILLIHGEKDSRIPPEHSRRIQKNAASETTLWIIPGGGHTNGFKLRKEEYIRKVSSYFYQQLAF